MILVADENIDQPIVEKLRYHGYTVEYVAELAPGITDNEVLELCSLPIRLIAKDAPDNGWLATLTHEREVIAPTNGDTDRLFAHRRVSHPTCGPGMP